MKRLGIGIMTYSEKESPIVDTGGKQTGGIMITPIPFCSRLLNPYATLPFNRGATGLMDDRARN